MSMNMRYLMIFLFTTIVLWGFSFWYVGQLPNTNAIVEHNVTDKSEESLAVNLPPQNFYERCRQLNRLEVINYNFTSSVPVQFNIHYHEGGEDYYPAEKPDALSGQGSYEPPAARIYCLMWGNNGDAPSRLEYTFRVTPKAP